MAKKIVAVNAGPRKGWNTDTLIDEAIKGAESAGAEVQNLTYSMDPMCCNENMIPVLLIMTSNAPDSAYQPLLKNYQQTFNRFVGPTEVFVSGDTLQIKDYSKTDWPWYFDAEAKQKRHETVFPREREKAFELGTAIAKKL